MNPRSYQRYDSHANAFGALDSRGAARLYATLKPRIEEAYKELGAPDGTFDRTLERAIVELLKTPVIEGDVAVTSDRVLYEVPGRRRSRRYQRPSGNCSAWALTTSRWSRRSCAISRATPYPDSSLPPDSGGEQ